MTSPEDAVERARRAAAEARAEGAYREEPPSFEVSPAARLADWRLTE